VVRLELTQQGRASAVIEGADAALAGRVRGNVQLTAEGLGELSVQGLFQSRIGSGCNRRMEEARAKGTVYFHDG